MGYVCAGGRDCMEVLPLLTHLVKHVADPRHSDLFIGVTNKFLDVYGVAVSLNLLPNMLLRSV